MNESDLTRNAFLLYGSLTKKGYMRWWHSFCGICKESGETKVFFIEYFLINPARGKQFPVLGQVSGNHSKRPFPSYVMVKAGVFGTENDPSGVQLHGFYPITDLRTTSSPFIFQIDRNFYSENHIYGHIQVTREHAKCRSYMSDAGIMEWDLEVHKAISFHTGKLANPCSYPSRNMYSLWHAEGIQTFYRGHVFLNGVAYQVLPQASYGYSDKHWGQRFPKPWLQFATSCLTSQTGRELKHSALACTLICPRFLCFPKKPRLLVQLTYEGTDYEYNYFRRDSHSRCKWNVHQTDKRIVWQAVVQNQETILKITGTCLKKHMISMQYEGPNGIKPSGPLWAGGTGIGTALLYRRTQEGKQLIDTLELANVFCEYGNWAN